MVIFGTFNKQQICGIFKYATFLRGVRGVRGLKGLEGIKGLEGLEHNWNMLYGFMRLRSKMWTGWVSGVGDTP